MTSKQCNEPYFMNLLKWTKLWVWTSKGHTYTIEDNKLVPQDMKGYVELAEILTKEFILENVKCENLSFFGKVRSEEAIWKIIDSGEVGGKKKKKKRKKRK